MNLLYSLRTIPVTYQVHVNLFLFFLGTLCIYSFPYFSKDKHLLHFTESKDKKDQLKNKTSYSRLARFVEFNVNAAW